jgi:hypothetical protein
MLVTTTPGVASKQSYPFSGATGATGVCLGERVRRGDISPEAG